MSRQFEVIGMIEKPSTLQMKPEKMVVTTSNYENGKSISIYCETLDLTFQVPFTSQIEGSLK